MALRQSRIVQPLAASLAQAIRDSGRATCAPMNAPKLLEAKVGAGVVRVYDDGRFEASDDAEAQALLVQCVKGILPLVDSPFVVGIDEAGMGGEAAQPVVAIVLLPSEVRADLIVQGVCDSKVAGNPDALAGVVMERAMRVEYVQVTEKAASHAKAVATAIGKTLLRWDDEGWLPANACITIDQTDETALQSAMGEAWTSMAGRIRVQPKADEEYVEVAAASILAKANRQAVTKGPAVQTPDLGLFKIGKWQDADKDQVLKFLGDLQHSYPDINKWIGKDGDPKAVWSKVLEGKYQLLVSRMSDKVAGFCLSQRKDERNVKLSTFYVAPKYRHQKIGHRLLDIELNRFAEEGVRRVMVTFGHEEFGNMSGFFREHGFTVDGISPQRYRDNSYEVVMGKRFRQGVVPEAEFAAFAQFDVFRMQGFNITTLNANEFLAVPSASLTNGPASRASRLFVHTTNSPSPETALAAVRAGAKKHNAAPVLVSSFGLPCETALPQDVEVLDALELERMFSPVRLDRPADWDVAIPIRPEYSSILFPDPGQTTFKPMKVGLRTTNVYYKVAKGDTGFRRGARIFFHESGGAGIFGYGHLEQVLIGNAKWIHNQTRGLGAWSQKEIEAHVGTGEAAAYRFSRFRFLRRPVAHADVKKLLPSYFPMTAFSIPSNIGNAIIDLGDKK